MTKINTDPTRGVTYLDSRNMIVRVGNPASRRDSIGHNVRGLYAYKNSYTRRLLVEGIKSCFKHSADGTLIAYRYPVERDGEDFHHDTSRDHINYAIAGLMMNGYDCDAARIARELGDRASAKFKFTFSGKVWMKSMYNRRAAKIIPFIFAFNACWTIPMNLILRRIGWFTTRPNLNVYAYHKGNNMINRNWWRRTISKAIYPTYAMMYQAFQLNAIKQTFLVKLTKRIILLDVEKSNYVLRYFLSDKFERSDLSRMEHYTPTAHFRWTTRLDESNDRNLDRVPIIPGANLEYDILKTIYDELTENPNGPIPNVVNYW